MKDLFIIPAKLKLPRTQFNAVVEDQISRIRSTLASKGQEYAPGQDDAMHNFNVTMAIKQAETGEKVTREDVIWGMACKHDISIRDMRTQIRNDQADGITLAALNEKIGDLINYYILLKASIMQTLGLSFPDVPIPLPDADIVRYEDLSLDTPLKIVGGDMAVKALAEYFQLSTEIVSRMVARKKNPHALLFQDPLNSENYRVVPIDELVSRNIYFKPNK